MRVIRTKPAPPLPQIQFTQEGFDKVKQDIGRLTEERKEILIRLQTAREMGDLSENGAYKAARFELSTTDRELRRLNYLARFGQITKKTSGSTVGFGSMITLDDGKKTLTFMLVDSYESNPKEQKLSVHSPIGKAVVGKKVGDTIVVTTPGGQINFIVKKVE